MTTVPDWMRSDADAPSRSRWQRLRGSSLGARLLYGAVAVTAVCVLYAVSSFVVAVHARSVARAALEQAAVDALPPGLPVVERGVFAVGDATGYASAFSPQPPAQVLPALRPAGVDDWQPIPGSDTPTQRAWLSASQRFILTIDALPCSAPRAPVGCPAGGSVLNVRTAPGGPRA